MCNPRTGRTRSAPEASSSRRLQRERKATPRPASAAIFTDWLEPSCRSERSARPPRALASASSTTARVPEPGSRSSSGARARSTAREIRCSPGKAAETTATISSSR